MWHLYEFYNEQESQPVIIWKIKIVIHIIFKWLSKSNYDEFGLFFKTLHKDSHNYFVTLRITTLWEHRGRDDEL